jgi:DNA-binding GntR family transcriptional regulator
MPEYYVSPALRQFGNPELLTVPLTGIEARIYDRLWRGIIAGKLKAGAKLREDVICDAFGVSRTVVRKVLVIMEQEGIVSLPPNHGAFVASPSPASVRAVVEVYHMQMAYILQELARPNRRLDEADRSLIEMHIAAQAEAEASGEFVTSRLLTGEFYVLLTAVHGNEILTQLAANLFTRYAMGLLLYQVPFQHFDRAPSQRQIYACILASDQEGAMKIVRDNFVEIEATLRFVTDDDEIDLRTILGGAPTDVEEKPKPARRGRRTFGRRPKAKTAANA